MTSGKKLSAFAKFAWFALAYNIVVILWGVFLRASYSGDGCGQHWITCHGEAVPSAPELKTLIEFSHRVTTAIAGLVVLILAGWSLKRSERGDRVRIFALLSLFFILVEGAIGGGLVLTGNTAGNWTPTRPYWTAGHLINTFLLIGFLALTAWAASNRGWRLRRLTAAEIGTVAFGLAAIIFVGVTGSMASLAHMLFPSVSITEGIAKDFDPNSHWLLRLRIMHPISSILAVVGLSFLSGWMKRRVHENAGAAYWSRNVSILVFVQLAFGAATLLTLAPIVMQLGHLLLADLIWISFVLLSISFVRDGSNNY
ncbi:MAG TPA: COX15/CtaA family protein [Pyrinomonadaceae bacterium]|nr:COX15/CtaA family protein [Pyrinomonadaceae bacterium]